VGEFLKKRGIKSALVIGTPATIRQGLYRFDGIRCFEPNDSEIIQLRTAIIHFNRGLEKQRQAEMVKGICGKYPCAQVIILGCTEFGVMLGAEDLPAINPIDVLVEATIRVVQKSKAQIFHPSDPT